MIRKFIIALLVIPLLSAWLSAETITLRNDNIYFGETQILTPEVKAKDRLIINAAGTLSGQLTIKAGGSSCRIELIKKMKAGSESEAKEYAAAITADYKNTKEGVVLSLRAPSRVPWFGTGNSANLDVTITIPKKTILEINTAYFDITATGPFAGFYVSESLSQVSIDGVIGPVEVKASNRPMLLKNITGRVVATNIYGRIRLENISTESDDATIRNENGEIQIDRFVGSLELSTSYAEIKAENITLLGQRNRIKNISAPIELTLDSLTSGKLRVNNNYGMITLNFNGPVDATFICKIGEESKINASGFVLEPSLVYDDRLEFDVGEATAEVRVTARGDGNIIISGPDEN